MISLVYFVFFLSGISGLIYQVIWVREFGQVFGNTVQSASLVSGTFVLGLGIGSWLAGRIIDRKNEASRKAGLAYYAYSEFLIGALGLAIALLTPRLEALSPLISSYTTGDHGWHELTATSYLLRYLVAVLLIGPITVLMGATLTFLIRFVLAESLDQAGWKIGLLYGMNTLGAAIGCALVDLWAVPALGLLHTKMIAVALNFVAAFSALYLLKTVRMTSVAPKTAQPPDPRATATPIPTIAGASIDRTSGRPRDKPRRGRQAVAAQKRAASTNSARAAASAASSDNARRDQEGERGIPPKSAGSGPAIAQESATLRRAALAIAISGFCAMGMEIVWFRFLSSVYSLSRYVFSLLLFTILVGMWAGSLLSGYLSKKFRNPERLYLYSQALFAVSLLLCLFLFFASDRRLLIDLFRDTFFGPNAVSQDSLSFKLYDYAVIVYPALMTLFVPAVLMGFAYPAISAIVQKNNESVGSRAGTIYLYNAVGALLGSVVTGFVLLPTIGMQNSVTVLAIGALLAAIPILGLGTAAPTRTPSLVPMPLASLAVVFLVLIVVWIARPADYVVRNSLLSDPTRMMKQVWIKISEGINEVAVVAEGHQGDGDRRATWRQLYTNGHAMAATDYSSMRYMSAFVHLPLLQMDDPKSVLVICFGVGNTLHAASLYPSVSRLEIVDLSKNILELAPDFAKWNRDVLKDPRTGVFVNDGRQHLRMQPENTYDLVTLEPPPLSHAGVASLYSEEFYRLVHRSLKKGGYLSQWLPVYQVAEEHNRRLVKSFLNVFPNAVLLNGSNKEFILLGQKEGPNQIDWRAFRKRLDANEKVRGELRSVDLTDPVEWLGTFTASTSWLKEKLSRVAPMTDDDPVIEDNHFLRYKFVPRDLLNTRQLVEWCPTCFVDNKLAPELRPLSYYLAILQNIYSNRDFLKDGPFIPDKKTYRIVFSRTDNSGVVPDAQHLLQLPTQEQFKEMLGKYLYFQTMFGPDWAFEYQP